RGRGSDLKIYEPGVGAENFYGWTGTRKWTVDRPAKGTPIEDGSFPRKTSNDDRVSGSADESAVKNVTAIAGREPLRQMPIAAPSKPNCIARLDNSRMVERGL